MYLAKQQRRRQKETAVAIPEHSEYSWFHPHSCEVKSSCFQDGEGGVVTLLLLLKTGSKAPVIFCVFSQASL